MWHSFYGIIADATNSMRERSEQDKQWLANKQENARLNQLLYTGWYGGIWRRGIFARQALKGLNEQRDGTITSPQVYTMPDGIGKS